MAIVRNISTINIKPSTVSTRNIHPSSVSTTNYASSFKISEASYYGTFKYGTKKYGLGTKYSVGQIMPKISTEEI